MWKMYHLFLVFNDFNNFNQSPTTIKMGSRFDLPFHNNATPHTKDARIMMMEAIFASGVQFGIEGNEFSA